MLNELNVMIVLHVPLTIQPPAKMDDAAAAPPSAAESGRGGRGLLAVCVHTLDAAAAPGRADDHTEAAAG